MSNIIEVVNTGNIVQVMDDGKTIEVLAGGAIEAIVNGSTNLAYTASPTNGIVTSDTGTDATIPLVSTDAGLMSPSDKTKLDGVATGATANATDAQLRDRATHTGTQAISTVSGLQTALDLKVDSNTTGIAGADAILNIVSLTTAEYTAISTPNASTLYIITDAT